jgi:hypothetical protein
MIESKHYKSLIFLSLSLNNTAKLIKKIYFSFKFNIYNIKLIFFDQKGKILI